MRFGVMIAAAAAVLCAGQADAARYYEFVISGTTRVSYFDPITGLSAGDRQYTSTVSAFFDTQVSDIPGLIATGDNLFLVYGPFGGSLRTIKSGTDGTTFSLNFDPSLLTGALQALPATGSYGFTTCTRYGCNNLTAGVLTSAMGRTFDSPPVNPIVGETLTSVAVGSVPEPATWAMMILGLGAVGYMTRRRRAAVKALA